MKHRICFVVSSIMTVKAFLMDQLTALRREYDVTVIANTDEVNLLAPLGVRLVSFAIERPVSPSNDAKALARLITFFRQERFDVVHSMTPKAGLLAMMASTVAAVPFRIHTFTGQVWATRSGAAREVLKTADRLLAALTTHALVDSPSQARFLDGEGVLSSKKSTVLGEGSVCGVDTARFRPDAASRARVRDAFGITDHDVAFLYLGRLQREKGLLELAAAFGSLAKEDARLHLLVVGPDEEGLTPSIERRAGVAVPRVHFVGYTDTPNLYMAAADVFCLPSYREGFGSVVIEAASAGVPAIGSRIYGLTDAIEEGTTGLLVPSRSEGELRDAMAMLANDDALRRAMGTAARERAERHFSSQRLTQAMVDFYRALFGSR